MTTVPLNGVDTTGNDSFALLTSSWQRGIPSSFTYDFPRRSLQLLFLLVVCVQLYVQATCKVLTAVLTIPGCVIWCRTHRHTGTNLLLLCTYAANTVATSKKTGISLFPHLKEFSSSWRSKTGLVLCSKLVLLPTNSRESASLVNQLLVQALGVLQVRK